MIYRSSILLNNSSEKEIVLHIEPWGEQIPMPVGCKLRIVAESTEAGEFEVEYLENSIMVWGWTGSTYKIYGDGQELGRDCPAVPPAPKGQSVSSFIRWLIKG